MASLPISKGIASVAMAGLFLTSLLNVDQLKWRHSDWWVFAPMVVWLTLLMSQLYSNGLAAGWKILYRQDAMLLLPFIYFFHQKLAHEKLLIYSVVYIAAVAFASLLTLLFYFLPESSTIAITSKVSLLQAYIPHEKQDAFGAYSPFLDRLHFSYLIGIAILLLIWLLFKQSAHIGFQVAMLILLIVTMLLLGARGGQLGLLVAITIWCVFLYLHFIHPRLKVRIGKFSSLSVSTLCILLGGLAIPSLTYKYVPAIQTRYNQLNWEIETFYNGSYVNHAYIHFTSIRRILSWQNTLQLIREQPLLGTGVGDFDATLQAIYERNDLGFPVNSHQQFLYYWGTSGLLSVLSFLVAFAALFWVIPRKKSWQAQALTLSFAGFYSVIFMLDAPLLYQVGCMNFWWFYLIFCGVGR